MCVLRTGPLALCAMVACAPPAPGVPDPRAAEPARAPFDGSRGRINPRVHGGDLIPRTSVAPPPLTSTPDAGPQADAGGGLTPDGGSSPDAGPGADGGGFTLDWNYPTSSPVNAPVALVVANYPNPTPQDAIFFGTRDAGGPNFFKLVNLYQPAPTLAWSATTAGLDGSAVTLSADGLKVFALDQAGDLHCFDAATGGLCTGWGAQSVSVGAPVSLSSPWVDYASGAVYFGDLSGLLWKVDGNSGVAEWRLQLGAPVRASPLAYGGLVYVGTDGGQAVRVSDPPAGGPSATSVSLCGAPSCGPEWAVANGASADLTTNTIYFAANGTVVELPFGGGAWAIQAQRTLGTPSGSVTYTSPIPDFNGRLYIAHRNTVFRLSYPFSGASDVAGTILLGGGSDSHPRSSPLIYGGMLYLGDGAGRAEQYGCLDRASAPTRLAVTPSYGVTADTTPVIDYANGNIMFGYEKSDGTGGLVQITQASWGFCSPENVCATAGCGSVSACTAAMACVPDAIPPSVTWPSSGGGSLSANGMLLDISIGGALVTGEGIAGSRTLVFGGLASETY